MALKKTRRMTALMAVMLMASAAAAPPGTVEGHLLAGHVMQNGQPLAGVAVVLTTGGGGTYQRTDAAGAYAFQNLLDGDYTVSARLPGFGFTPIRRTLHLQDFDVSSLNFEATFIGSAPGSVSAPPPAAAVETPPAARSIAVPPPAVVPVTPPLVTAPVIAAAGPPAAVQAPVTPPAPMPVQALPPAAAAAATAATAGEISGHVTLNGLPVNGVTVGYNILRTPGVEVKLPATLTAADGSYSLPVLPPAPPGEPQPWLEARSSLAQFCPAQRFAPALAGADFSVCLPPEPSATPHLLAGNVTRLGKGVPRVEIHQVFATREGLTYSLGKPGPAVAYTDETGHWQFSAPSISARNLTSGFYSYLTAELPGGPQFCPGQLFLPETLVNAEGLDFSACASQPGSGSSALGSTRIAAAPAAGNFADVSVALSKDQPSVAWVQDRGGAATLWFSRWDNAKQAWSEPLKVADARSVDDPGRRVSLAAAGDFYGIAYMDRDDPLGAHVVVTLSSDGGATWQPAPLANFDAHSSSPALALDARGTAHLAYYFEGDGVPVRRVMYQRRAPGGAFGGSALPLTNILNRESGWWAQPPVALALDDNGLASVSYFLAGPDHYLQLAYWKSGMPTAVKIADTHQATADPAVQMSALGGRANAIYRLTGDTDSAPGLWLAGGTYGATWPAPLRLPSNSAEGSVAAAVNASGDFAYAVAGEPSFLLLRERGGDVVPASVASADARGARHLSLALDNERRVSLAYIDARDGSLMIYRAALPWN